MTHACNPSYSGGRDLEDQGSNPAWANSLWYSTGINPSQKRTGGVAQGEGPEFKPQYYKKKKSPNESPKKQRQTNKQKSLSSTIRYDHTTFKIGSF
jgi:hypothetical protein